MADGKSDLQEILVKTARELTGGENPVSADAQKLILETIVADYSAQASKPKSTFSAQTWIVLTALITGAVNFGFEYYRANHTAELDLASKGTQAELDAKAKRGEFEYNLLAKELDGNKTEAQRAEVLLFLARIGVLSNLNVVEIEKIAQSHLPAGQKVGIPALQSDVRKILLDQGGENVSERLSDRAIDLIVRWEGMPRSTFDRMHRERPFANPRFGGVEIGFGYSLGIVAKEQFRHDWSGILDDATLALLEPAVGVRDADKSKEFAASLSSDVVIPYEAAQKNMVRTLIIDEAGALLKRYPSTGNLSQDCFGAVLSVYMYRRFGGPNKAAMIDAVTSGDASKIGDAIKAINDIAKPRHAEEANLCKSVEPIQSDPQ